MNNKRLLICTTGGVIAGIICLVGGHLTGNIKELAFSEVAPTFFNRIMLGFVIGISTIKINYLLHGILIGFLISLISSIGFTGPDLTGFILFTTAGIIYGFLIELFATRIFKAGIA